MTYLAWAAFYEGSSDQSYYDILLPRIMDEIILTDGHRSIIIPESPAVPLGSNGRSVQEVANEICSNRAAFHLLFVHADTGGRAQEASVDRRSISYCEAAHVLCQWPLDRCVIISPRHETEAWILADPNAVTAAFGYRGSTQDLELPNNAQEAERISDPKALLASVHKKIRGRRSGSNLLQALPTIDRTQSLELLRASASFVRFELNLRSSLISLGCLPQGQ